MTSSFVYTKDGKDYPVVLTTKRMRSIRYRYRDGTFVVSAPFLTPQTDIVRGIDKFFDRLTKENPHCSGLTNDYIYLLGIRIPLESEGKIRFSDGTFINYESQEELKKKLKKWFLAYITSRHRQYEKTMKTVANKVRVRQMYTRYGSNSIKNKSITYSTILMHYKPEIIDSVIVHELAHCYEIGHGPKFYKIVYKYCPNYEKLHKNLRKGNYQND